MDIWECIPVFCGACILLWVFISLLIRNRRCTLRVQAICVEHKKRHNKFTYCPVYEIPWKGSTIRIDRGVYFNKLGKIRPAVGTKLWLRVNPNNPLEFVSRFDLQEELAPICVGLIFILMPIYFVYFYKG